MTIWRRAATVVLVAVAVLGASVLGAAVLGAACGGKAKVEPARALRVLMTDDWVTPAFLDAVREFERSHPGVRVDIERGPIGEMADAVRAGISSGDPPDVVQGHAYSAAGQELAQPLDDLWAASLSATEFLPGAVEDVTWAGRRYGIPLDTNAMAVLYNVEHFRAAGAQPPGPATTFAQFEALARSLTTPDGSRRGLAVTLSNWTTYGWIRANGGEVTRVGDDGEPVFSLDHPRVVEALAFLARLVREGVAFGPAPVDARSADAFALFAAGRASMHTSGSWDLVRVRKEAAQGHWGVALMPSGAAGARGTVIGGSSLWVPRGSDERELAFQFMVHLVSDPYAIRFAVEEGRLPVRPRLFDDPAFSDPDIKVFLTQLEVAHAPLLGAFHEASQAFEVALARVLVDRADPTVAMADAQGRAVTSRAPP